MCDHVYAMSCFVVAVQMHHGAQRGWRTDGLAGLCCRLCVHRVPCLVDGPIAARLALGVEGFERSFASSSAIHASPCTVESEV